MRLVGRCRRWLRELVVRGRRGLGTGLWARPVVGTHSAGTGGDLLRSRTQLLAENALLRLSWLEIHPASSRGAAIRVVQAIQDCDDAYRPRVVPDHVGFCCSGMGSTITALNSGST